MNRITAAIILFIFAIVCLIIFAKSDSKKNPFKHVKSPNAPVANYFTSEKLDTGVTNIIGIINYKDRLASGTYKRGASQGPLQQDDALSFAYQSLDKPESTKYFTIHATDFDYPTACGIEKIEINREKQVKLFFNSLYVSPEKKRLLDVEAATIIMLRKIADETGKETDQAQENRKTWQ